MHCTYVNIYYLLVFRTLCFYLHLEYVSTYIWNMFHLRYNLFYACVVVVVGIILLAFIIFFTYVNICYLVVFRTPSYYLHRDLYLCYCWYCLTCVDYALYLRQYLLLTCVLRSSLSPDNTRFLFKIFSLSF